MKILFNLFHKSYFDIARYKTRIQLFSLQLWVNSRVAWVL